MSEYSDMTYGDNPEPWARQSAADRRQDLPTGDGMIVLGYVRQKMDIAIGFARIPQALPQYSMRESDLLLLMRDLEQRCETGTKKYGSPLRVNNGRNATLDLYQEICDGIMYAAQCHLERKPGGEFYEALVEFGSKLVAQIEKQNNQQG